VKALDEADPAEDDPDADFPMHDPKDKGRKGVRYYEPDLIRCLINPKLNLPPSSRCAEKDDEDEEDEKQ
jgi:hypothetical protein